MKVAIMPARGGSKRVPRKNIRCFAGRPMIHWALRVARLSGLFDHIVVSTEDDEIGSVAEAEGASVPFRRPDNLSDDKATTLAVIQHAIGEITRQFEKPSHVCCIYPTAAFIKETDLSAAAWLVEHNEARLAYAVASYPHPIQRAIKISDHQIAGMFWPENANVRTQDLEPAYYDAGQFYFGTTDAFVGADNILDVAATAIVLPRYRVHDIDTEEDWLRAERVFDALGFAHSPACQLLE